MDAPCGSAPRSSRRRRATRVASPIRRGCPSRGSVARFTRSAPGSSSRSTRKKWASRPWSLGPAARARRTAWTPRRACSCASAGATRCARARRSRSCTAPPRPAWTRAHCDSRRRCRWATSRRPPPRSSSSESPVRRGAALVNSSGGAYRSPMDLLVEPGPGASPFSDDLKERLREAVQKREERPDVDSIYMQAVQLLTQHGGWPMSVFLAPDRKPFYGGTYFPPRDGMRGARIGFASLLKELHRVYSQERERAVEAGDQIAQAIRGNLSAAAPTSLPGVHVLNGAAESYGELFDPEEGGVKRAPKFPSSLGNRFLLRYWKRTGAEEARNMATLSLTRMARGGS